MTSQWGPRPGGPQVPMPRPRKGPSGCLIVLMLLLGGLGLLMIPIGLAQFAEGGVALVLFGVLLLAGPAVYFWAIASGPARERRAAEKQQAETHRQLEEWRSSRPAEVIARSDDPLGAAQWQTRQLGGCAFLGVDAGNREWVVADRQQAALVLGPPRSGKTTSLIIPSILNASGPVVSTSTKAEVLRATAAARSRLGRVWSFDPSGAEEPPTGVLELHWSPVRRSRTWDGARAMADVMVGASPAGARGDAGVSAAEPAGMLLAPLLHAAAVSGKTVVDVRRWVSRADVVEAAQALEAAGAMSAAEDLDSMAARTDERERAGIFAAVRVVLSAYGSEQAGKRSRRQNFDADKFVRSTDTIYITAPSDQQAALAPLVAGLLDEIRDATYRYARTTAYSSARDHPVMWALDEVANIAPLKNLPAIVSEAGGQGLQVMACLQDLSQARTRWGGAAEGFLSLFGTKIIFPGMGDKATLEALSTMVGDWDRPYTVYNVNTGNSTSYGLPTGASESRSSGQGWSHSTQREARITPAELANIPPGHALVVRSGRWNLVETTPFYQAEPWRAALAKAPARIQAHGDVDQLVDFFPHRQGDVVG